MVGAIIGLAGMAYGAISSAIQNNKARKLTAKAKAENKAWYDRRYNENYTQTAEAQAAINSARDYAREVYNNSKGAAAVSGATDASVAQSKAKANDMISDAVRNIAAQGTTRKDNIENSYRQANTELTNQQVAAYQAQAQEAAQAGSQALQAGISYEQANMDSVKNTGKNLFGRTVTR